MTPVMLVPRTRTGEAGRWTATPVAPGWTACTFTGELPDGTISAIELALHVGGSTPPDRTRVVLDNMQVTGHAWTDAGDNGRRQAGKP